jgi:murein DD-endopeptidase MepM/ murein hydrolase activator NlpD
MKKNLVFLGLLLLTAIIVIQYTKTDNSAPYVQEEEEVIKTPDYFFGFDKADFYITHDTIKKNQYVADILLPYISYPSIEKLLKCDKDVFNAKAIRPGQAYHIVRPKNNDSTVVAMIYEKDALNYAILHLADSLYAEKGKKDVTLKDRVAEGVIKSSLSKTLSDQGLSQALAVEMADIFAWTIDFYKLNEGDHFQVLFEEKYVESDRIGIGNVKAITFFHKGREYKAYAYEQNGKMDYFDEEGEGLRKAFLKSPLKFGRMTSSYSNRRFHPVQKRFKAHKGTDYAAATGTPILSTGDGKVIEARFKRNNGNYVKIKHNGTYTTQYLHMSKIGVKTGQYVKQGDVIGYVGSTGLATGPHVCYRFWKNGVQVDHRKEEFPSTDPVLPENMPDFKAKMQELEQKLHSSKLYAETK